MNDLVPVSPATFILLDRSGSMSSQWTEAVGAVNAYVETLAAEFPRVRLTLAVFDGHSGRSEFAVLRDGVEVASCAKIKEREAPPRGMTPLYDALVRLVASAEEAAAAKTSIVVMTDGEENASREATRETAKAALDRCRARGWDVVFLGAGWDAFDQAAGVGTRSDNTLNAKPESYGATMSLLATRTASYAKGTLSAGASFTASDRARAAGKKDWSES